MFEFVPVEKVPYSGWYLWLVASISILAICGWEDEEEEEANSGWGIPVIDEPYEGKSDLLFGGKLCFFGGIVLMLAAMLWIPYHFWLGGSTANIANRHAVIGTLLFVPLAASLIVWVRSAPIKIVPILGFIASVFLCWYLERREVVFYGCTFLFSIHIWPVWKTMLQSFCPNKCKRLQKEEERRMKKGETENASYSSGSEPNYDDYYGRQRREEIETENQKRVDQINSMQTGP